MLRSIVLPKYTLAVWWNRVKYRYHKHISKAHTQQNQGESVDASDAEAVNGVEEMMLIPATFEQSGGAHDARAGSVQVQLFFDLRQQRRNITIVLVGREQRGLMTREEQMRKV